MPVAASKRKASAKGLLPRVLLPLLLVLLLSAAGAHAQSPASAPPPTAPAAWVRGCLPACERTVSDRTLRARVCNRCLFHGDARGGWVKDLAKGSPFPTALLKEALGDPDWQVVREAAAALAKRQGRTMASVLSDHLAAVKPKERDGACLTVARVGADRKVSWKKWQRALSGAFSIAARCERSVRTQLEVELYGLTPSEGREALLHLSALFGRTPTQVVLDAMRTRPEEADDAAAKVLLEHAARGGPPVGLALLRAATEENAPYVNRLVARYMAQLEARAKAPKPTESLARRTAVTELGRYAPLSAPELEGYLWDADLPVRLAAARALAAGEGRTLGEAVRARVLTPGPKPLPAEAQARWVDLLGAKGGRECREGPLSEIARADVAPQEVRTAAVVAYAGCAGSRARPLVQGALSDEAPSVRAGGVLAQAELGPLTRTREVVAQALIDGSPLVRKAACEAVGQRRLGDLAEPVSQNLEAEEATLRRAAVEALGLLQERAYAGAVARRLGEDPDREVRLASVTALSRMGGPRAAAALSEARSRDAESRVRREAEGALRRMGFAP